MIPFPFSLYYIVSSVTGLQPFTGFYESYESYIAGLLDIFTSGVVLQSGSTTYTTGEFGWFTGHSFWSDNTYADSYEYYNTGLNKTEYTLGTGWLFGSNIYGTGLSYFPSVALNENYEYYSSGFSSEFPLGYYSGKGFWGKISTGHSTLGYVRPLLATEILSIPNRTSIGPSYFTGSGLIITGDLDQTNNVKIGYLNRASGLYFFDHVLRWDRPAGNISNFTIEVALRRSGWALASSRIIDNNSASGFALARGVSANTLRAGVSGSFTDSTYILPDDRWTYVSLVRSGSQMRFYFSGILSNTITTNGADIIQYFPIYLGRRATVVPEDLRYQGYMDEFRFWNYARTSGQIYSGSTGTVDPNEAGLQCYLSLGF